MNELQAIGTALYPVTERGVSSPKVIQGARADYRASSYGERPTSAFVFYGQGFAAAPPHIPDLHPGAAWMSDDFDAPLPEDFLIKGE